MPLIDLDTGEVLDRALVGTLDRIERDGDGRIVVVDLKTPRKYGDLQVEASLQRSVYSYAPAMNGLADQEDLRLRFDVLTTTTQPELHRYWTPRDRAASLRLFRLVAEVLQAIAAAVFHPTPAGSARTYRLIKAGPVRNMPVAASHARIPGSGIDRTSGNVVLRAGRHFRSHKRGSEHASRQ